MKPNRLILVTDRLLYNITYCTVEQKAYTVFTLSTTVLMLKTSENMFIFIKLSIQMIILLNNVRLFVNKFNLFLVFFSQARG